MVDQIIVFGSGGHSKVVLEALRMNCPLVEIAVLDDQSDAVGTTVLGLPVVGGRDWLSSNWPSAPVVLALGRNEHRAKLIEWLMQSGRHLATVVHEAAVVSPSAVIGEGSFIAAGAVVNAEARVGRGAIINTAASVDHDSKIGFCAHVAPGARLCGTVSVGDHTLIGVGSVVIPGVRIGARVTVGAGSVVLKDVPDGARVAGSPARQLR